MTIKPRSITPYLWFKEGAEEAARFYVSLFEGSRLTGDLAEHLSGDVVQGEGGSEFRPKPGAPPMVVTFNLAGQDFIALNGGPQFPHTEAFSIFVQVDTQKDVDELWNKLTANGGQESMCGWLKDRWGLSWQIVPKKMLDMFADKDTAKAKRAMDAMLQMKKIDLAKIEAAYAGR